MVLEIPPADGEGSITGSVDDGWQTAIEDVGPAGVDKGKGGKYLILPPGYKEKVPDGYIPLPSSTFRLRPPALQSQERQRRRRPRTSEAARLDRAGGRTGRARLPSRCHEGVRRRLPAPQC